MKRHVCQPRLDWRARVESQGLSYHSHETGPYWDESACYEFSTLDVERLETATKTLHRLSIEAAGHVIETQAWERLGIPSWVVPALLRSWERDDFSVYGRFDFAYDGVNPPKMLEYNADTPTALIEAAVIQWYWLKDTHPTCDQFNSLHERLIEAWRRMARSPVYFSGLSPHAEDEQTLLYLSDTCAQAGIEARHVRIEDLGWNVTTERFVDFAGAALETVFKLYPWEWMCHEPFGRLLEKDSTRWVEPLWKMLLSNKGILPVLWELNPGHPNLLPAYSTPEKLGGDFVRKPLLSREGANVTLVQAGSVVEDNPGDYGSEGFIYQALAPDICWEGNRTVLGCWVVDHEPAGLGIREDQRRITGNLSRFVPHYITAS